MSPRLAFLLLPYTRNELPGWGRLLQLAGFGRVLGGLTEPMHPKWKDLPPAIVKGKNHGFRMRLDRSDWAQCCTYFLGRYYELGVQRTLDRLLRPGDTFVDIGANIGMVTLHARSRVGAEGRIVCFEPNPECAASIAEHLSMNGIRNVDIRPCALASKAGTLALSFTGEHTGTATLTSVAAATRSIDVPVRVGDDELRDQAPRVIKIDVEGFELEVLRGLTTTLERHRPFLITELVGDHLARAGTLVSDIGAFLADIGYEPYGIGTTRSPIRHDLVLHRREAPTDEFTDWLWQPRPGKRVSVGVDERRD